MFITYRIQVVKLLSIILSILACYHSSLLCFTPGPLGVHTTFMLVCPRLSHRGSQPAPSQRAQNSQFLASGTQDTLPHGSSDFSFLCVSVYLLRNPAMV